MKKRISFRKLGRTSAHKMAMLRNMVTSLIKHERIVTTVPKAKELRHIAEHMITLAKRQDERKLHAIRQANAVVREKRVLTKLFEVLGPRYEQRQGGYTRILKLSKPRAGDNAPMAVMEYVDRPGEIRAARPPASLQQMSVLADVLKDMGITPLKGMSRFDLAQEVEVFHDEAVVSADYEETLGVDAAIERKQSENQEDKSKIDNTEHTDGVDEGENDDSDPERPVENNSEVPKDTGDSTEK